MGLDLSTPSFCAGVAVGWLLVYASYGVRLVREFFCRTHLYQEISPIALNLERRSTWINLGYWKTATTYPQACEDLARLLGNAVGICKEDTVLDVGCGYGDQLLLWSSAYQAKKVIGVNISRKEVDGAKTLVHNYLRGIPDREQSSIVVRVGDATKLPESSNSMDVILSLDAAYHFDTREDFFHEAMRCSTDDSRLGLVDICLCNSLKDMSFLSRTIVWATCQLTGIPYVNMCTQAEYMEQLEEAGFIVKKAEMIEGVLDGFADFTCRHHARVGKFLHASEWSRFRNAAIVLGWVAERRLIDFYVFVAGVAPAS